MVRCDMCGMEVPVGPNGTCFLGHRLPEAVAASAVAAATPPAPQVTAEPLPQPAPATVDVAAPMPIAVAEPTMAEPAIAADTLSYPTSISPDLIAAAIAEVEKPRQPESMPVTEAPAMTPPRPLGSPPPAEGASSLPAPRPLGSPAPAVPAVAQEQNVPAAPAAFTPPRPLGAAPLMQATEPPVPPPAVVAPVPVVTPPAVFPVNAVPSGDFGVAASSASFSTPSLPTSGNVALAEASPVANPAAPPVADMFVVNSPAAPKSKLIVLIAAGVALIVAAVGLKTFAFKSQSQPAGAEPGPVQRQAQTLVRAFTVGESHRYEVHATMATTLTGDGGSMDSEAVFDAQLTESILNRTQDGTTTARYSLDRMKITVDGQTMAAPHSPGAGVVVTVDKNGRVIGVKQDSGGGIPMQADLSFHEMFAPVLPPGVRPGDRWTRVDQMNVPGLPEPVKATSRFHLKSVKDGKGTLESSTEVPVNVTIPVAEVSELFGQASGGEVTMRGRFLGTGSQIVDLASGRSLSASGDMAVTLAFFRGDTQMARMTMKIAMTVREAGGVSSTAA